MAKRLDLDRSWWLRPDGDESAEHADAYQKVSKVIKQLIDNRDPMRRAAMIYSAMYWGNGNMNGLLALGGRTMTTAIGPRSESGLSLNVTRSVIDAAVSLIASKSRPQLTYVTEGGDPEKQHNAEQLEHGTEGVFYKTEAYKKFVRAHRSACVFGTSVIRAEADQDCRDVTVKNLLHGQLIVDDEGDVYDGCPRNWYCVTPVDKYVLAYLYRDDEVKRQRILHLSDDRQAYAQYGFAGTGLQLYVYEAWHVPSGRHANDGRYVKAVGNCTLEDKPWDGGRRGKPPFACIRWSEIEGSFWGQGIAEQGKGIQGELNALVRQIQNGHHLITGHWLVEGNSEVITAHINNDLSRILRFKGTPPIYQAPTIIAPEMYKHLWDLRSQYYELAGVSEAAAAAQKPAGLDSGEAQREYKDTQTETLLTKGNAYEDFVMECGELCVDAAKELAETGVYEVRASADDAFETINWQDLDDPDGYECRVSPTSSLPGTPSGKINLANDLMKLGVYDTSDLAEIVAFVPDVKQKNALKLASRRLVEKRVGLMLRTGEAWAPPPYINLAEAEVIATQMLCLAESKDVPENKLELVRQFIDAVTRTKASAQPPPPPQAMAPGQPGMMAPGTAGPAAPPAAAPPLPTVPHAA